MPGGNKKVTHLKLQVYLSMCDPFVTTGIKGLNLFHLFCSFNSKNLGNAF